MRLLCRIGLHKWKRHGHGDTTILRCDRCGKERDPNPFAGGFTGPP
jgi:hypothetical protein